MFEELFRHPPSLERHRTAPLVEVQRHVPAGAVGRFSAGSLRPAQSVHEGCSPNNRAFPQPPTPPVLEHLPRIRGVFANLPEDHFPTGAASSATFILSISAYHARLRFCMRLGRRGSRWRIARSADHVLSDNFSTFLGRIPTAGSLIHHRPGTDLVLTLWRWSRRAFPVQSSKRSAGWVPARTEVAHAPMILSPVGHWYSSCCGGASLLALAATETGL